MDHLSRTFAALSDPTRRAILEQLMSGDASFTDLARPHEISRPAVVKHIKALERAGLITRAGPERRPIYQLDAAAMKATCDWLDRYRAFWGGSLDRLDAYVGALTDGKGGKA